MAGTARLNQTGWNNAAPDTGCDLFSNLRIPVLKGLQRPALIIAVTLNIRRWDFAATDAAEQSIAR